MSKEIVDPRDMATEDDCKRAASIYIASFPCQAATPAVMLNLIIRLLEGRSRLLVAKLIDPELGAIRHADRPSIENVIGWLEKETGRPVRDAPPPMKWNDHSDMRCIDGKWTPLSEEITEEKRQENLMKLANLRKQLRGSKFA